MIRKEKQEEEKDKKEKEEILGSEKGMEKGMGTLVRSKYEEKLRILGTNLVEGPKVTRGLSMQQSP